MLVGCSQRSLFRGSQPVEPGAAGGRQPDSPLDSANEAGRGYAKQAPLQNTVYIRLRIKCVPPVHSYRTVGSQVVFVCFCYKMINNAPPLLKKAHATK